MATCAANQQSFDETKIKQGSIFAWTYHFLCFIGEYVTFCCKNLFYKVMWIKIQTSWKYGILKLKKISQICDVNKKTAWNIFQN